MVHAKHIYIANNAAAHLYADTGLFRMFLLSSFDLVSAVRAPTIANKKLRRAW